MSSEAAPNPLNTPLMVESFDVKPGFTFRISTASMRHKLLTTLFNYLGIGHDEENLPDYLTDKHSDLAFNIYAIFNPETEAETIPQEALDAVTDVVNTFEYETFSNRITQALTLVNEKLLTDQTDIVFKSTNDLLLNLQAVPASEEKKVAKKIAAGGAGAVVTTEDGEMYKIMFLVKGVEETLDKWTHVGLITSILQNAPDNIRRSLILPESFSEAQVDLSDDYKPLTYVAKLPEARGTQLSEWQPTSVENYKKVVRRFSELVSYMHAVNVINVDSGDGFIDGDDVAIHDHEESIFVGKKEIHYPSILHLGVHYYGKLNLPNLILYIRDITKPMNPNTGKWIEMHNYMMQFFNKLIGSPHALAHFTDEFLRNGSEAAYKPEDIAHVCQVVYKNPERFVTLPTYPLISYEEFEQRFIFTEPGINIRAIYEVFEDFFNGYQNQARNDTSEINPVTPPDSMEKYGKRIIDAFDAPIAA